MKLKLFKKRAIIEKNAGDTRALPSGIFLSLRSTVKPDTAIVVETSPQSQLKPGDQILIGKYAGQHYKLDNINHHIVDDDEIIAKINNTQLEAFDKWVVFRWVDTIKEEREFVRNGILIQRKTDKNRTRWGLVVTAGPNSKIKAGQYILPEKTYGWDSPAIQQVEGGNYYLDGEDEKIVTLFKTKEQWCAFVSDDISVTYATNNEVDIQKAIDIKDPNNWAAGCKID